MHGGHAPHDRFNETEMVIMTAHTSANVTETTITAVNCNGFMLCGMPPEKKIVRT
jgi:hypothetical protein